MYQTQTFPAQNRTVTKDRRIIACHFGHYIKYGACHILRRTLLDKVSFYCRARRLRRGLGQERSDKETREMQSQKRSQAVFAGQRASGQPERLMLGDPRFEKTWVDLFVH